MHTANGSKVKSTCEGNQLFSIQSAEFRAIDSSVACKNAMRDLIQINLDFSKQVYNLNQNFKLFYQFFIFFHKYNIII